MKRGRWFEFLISPLLEANYIYTYIHMYIYVTWDLNLNLLFSTPVNLCPCLLGFMWLMDFFSNIKHNFPNYPQLY